jgi:cell division protease FtsH
MPWAPFYVEYKRNDDAIGHTRNELLDMICVLYGAIEAERLLLQDISSGAGGFGYPGSDLARATKIAEHFVETCGMSDAGGLRIFRNEKGEREVLSGMMAEKLDKQINAILSEQQARAAKIILDHKDDLIRLRDELREKKVLERDRVQEIIAEFKRKQVISNQ